MSISFLHIERNLSATRNSSIPGLFIINLSRYHMYGDDIGTLNVYIQADGQLEQLVWTLSGNQGFC